MANNKENNKKLHGIITKFFNDSKTKFTKVETDYKAADQKIVDDQKIISDGKASLDLTNVKIPAGSVGKFIKIANDNSLEYEFPSGSFGDGKATTTQSGAGYSQAEANALLLKKQDATKAALLATLGYEEVNVPEEKVYITKTFGQYSDRAAHTVNIAIPGYTVNKIISWNPWLGYNDGMQIYRFNDLKQETQFAEDSTNRGIVEINASTNMLVYNNQRYGLGNITLEYFKTIPAHTVLRKTGA